ncbi:type I DNA topoisomerase [bacterium]|nr:type I DNA topoisomerase [bacterium]
MPKHLLIVESPAKAKTISKFLGKDFDIKASFGHVRDLPEYTLGIDVKNNFFPKYQVIKDKTKFIKEFKKIGKSADTVYIATDPDREGEAIAWHIQESIELPESKIRRIVFHEITEAAIQNAITNSRAIDSDLVDAQQARRVLDRLIGYKLSPILSKKIRKGLSAGRVQSVALKLVCDREKKILAFVPEEYWVVATALDSKNGKFLAKLSAEGTPTTKAEPKTEADATRYYDLLKTAAYEVSDLKKAQQNRYPQPPFITSTLQQEASRKLNWSTKKTMMVAQQLYEGIDVGSDTVGLISYMRTDSFRVSDEARAGARQFIAERYSDKYLPSKPNHYKNKGNTQDAHEAIRPTYMTWSPDKLEGKISGDQYKLYRLIWDRFISSQMVPALVENTQVTVKATATDSTALFLKASGQVILFNGFMSVYTEGTDNDSEEDDGRLPLLENGQSLNLKSVTKDQKFTQPPHRFTEATLVKEMEENGIGRPSTYAPTIGIIIDRGYVEKDKRTLLPTELGMTVNDKLQEFFSEIIDTEFTADMENRLDEITEGKHEWADIVHQIYDPFVTMLKKADTEMEKINNDRPTEEVCEKCGHPMVIKAGRFGDFLACSNFPECKNTKSIRKPLEVSCPDCGGEIAEKRSKRGKVFYGCGNYPKCTFALWDKPVPGPCPSCANPLLVMKQSRGKSEQKTCPKCNSTVD